MMKRGSSLEKAAWRAMSSTRSPELGSSGRRRKGAHALRQLYTPPVPALALAPRLGLGANT